MGTLPVEALEKAPTTEGQTGAGQAPKEAATPQMVVSVRHWGRLVSAFLTLFVAAALVYVVARDSVLHWATVPSFIFNGQILSGVVVTIELTVLSMLLGVGLGTLLAVMRMSENPVTRTASATYVSIVRGTPMLVQIIFWFNIALFLPRITFGSFDVSTNTIISPFIAAVLGLGLNEAAFMAEVVRSGIIAIDRGQREAALALGYTPRKTMFRIILPQSMRVILPPTGNETIGMLKGTSLVSVIGAQDLLTRAQGISSYSYQIVEMLLVATVWYVVMTTVLSIGQAALERKFGRSVASARPPSAILKGVRTLIKRSGATPA